MCLGKKGVKQRLIFPKKPLWEKNEHQTESEMAREETKSTLRTRRGLSSNGRLNTSAKITSGRRDFNQ